MSSADDRLAVILAREGSKRVPGKNIRLLSGKPLLAYTLEAALQSECFGKVLVSTDSQAIADIAQKWGAWVPFLRPPELASDSASSFDALLHAVRWVTQATSVSRPATICLIQPTSPFLRSHHVREAAALFDREPFDSLSSMCVVKERPEWMFQTEATGKAWPVDPEKFELPALKLSPLFRENGAMYFVKTDWLLLQKKLYNVVRHGLYCMSSADSVDIDTPEDWQFAEFLMLEKQNSSEKNKK